MSDDDIPPWPMVHMGRGRWLTLIRILKSKGTKEADRLAEQIDQQIRHR